jgi:hypothetical protein
MALAMALIHAMSDMDNIRILGIEEIAWNLLALLHVRIKTL